MSLSPIFFCNTPPARQLFQIVDRTGQNYAVVVRSASDYYSAWRTIVHRCYPSGPGKMLSPQHVLNLASRTPLQLILIVGGVVPLIAAFFLFRGWRAVRRRVIRLIAAIFLFLIALPLTIAGGYLFWYTHRSQPTPADRELFSGVHYTLRARQSPRPIVVHTVTIDLTNPGVSFLTTPPTGTPQFPLAAQNVSTFLENAHAQIAINGSYYHPCTGSYLWNYFPHAGDFVNVVGINASRGTVYQPIGWTDATLYLSPKNGAALGSNPTTPAIWNALSGGQIVVRDGVPIPFMHAEIQISARSAVGLSADRKTLMLIAIDGNQPHVSEGVSLAELAALLASLNLNIAMSLDGGGSTALAYERSPGHAALLNTPFNFGFVGMQRPVGNALLIFAAPLPPAR
jgi:hypothetical protein